MRAQQLQQCLFASNICSAVCSAVVSRVINYAVTGSVSKVLEDLNILCLGSLKGKTQHGVAARSAQGTMLA